jgi:hypothetical protein
LHLFFIPGAYFSASPVLPGSSGEEDSVELSNESVEIGRYIKGTGMTGQTGKYFPNIYCRLYWPCKLCSRVALPLHYDFNIFYF